MQPGDRIDNRYRIERLLGEGGMGRVFLAFDESLEKQVALKTLLPSLLTDRRAVSQLKREVRTAQELRHPNICAIYDFHDTGHQPFIVMEFVDGETLTNFIFDQPGHKCSVEQFESLSQQIIQAVAVAHKAGVVHRDLKSLNIMVKPDGEIRIMDFGIAATLKETYSRSTGSPISLSMHFASPEQIRGEPPSLAMDTYSLGCIFYEMLTGAPPFTRGDILYQQLSVAPPPLVGVAPGTAATVMACLEKAAEKRPRIADIGFDSAQRTVKVQPAPQFSAPRPPVSSRPPESTFSVSENARGRSWAPLVLLAAATVLAAAGLWLWNSSLRKMEFVSIPAGSFEMGCSPGDGECEQHERPQRTVRITKGFEMGKYEVTQGEWEGVMGSNPSYLKGSNRPVEQVSWEDAQAFLGKLNERRDGYRYRLPTEAEWEYAARAGSKGKYYGELGQIEWLSDNTGSQTHAVGEKSPNGWGLHDILGNVGEWCGDWYGAYDSGATVDPGGPATGQNRVLRGGSWFYYARILRVSFRIWFGPGDRSNFIGFRCVREVIP